ncbi:hypothetical protein AB4865_10210 [Capnocytophaga sp. ARDL2]|uniref:hypothetical protein n=1 Tax=Capnocytophaga sp. ARDL2 TaxID=3238809 RepID=UPI00355871BD
MKKLILLTISLLCLVSCKEDEKPIDIDPVDLLPPATQHGAVMFACTVNGEPYICKGYDQVTSYYQWVNGGYGFVVTGRKKTNLIWTITIGNRGNSPIQMGTFILNHENPGYAGGGGVIGGVNNSYQTSLTTNIYTGEMTITKFDLQNEIVSGTFWFDIENPWTGETIEIRNGRFDTHFSQ